MIRPWLMLPIFIATTLAGCGDRGGQEAVPDLDRQQAAADAPPQPAPADAEPVGQTITPEETADPRLQPDSLVAAFVRGEEWNPAPHVRRALDECPSATTWHDRVLEALLSLPLQDRTIELLSGAGITTVHTECRDDRVGEWLRRALATDLSPNLYRRVLGLAVRLEDPTLDAYITEIASDGYRSAELRAEVLRTLGFAQDGFAGLPEFVASSYSAGRLVEPFIQRWVPMLLSSAETRDETVRLVLPAIVQNANREGNFTLLRMIGGDVGAYPALFSPGSIAAVDEAMIVLERNGMRGLVQALGAARAAGRNAEGVRVRPRRLDWRLEQDGARCRPVWPPDLERAVEAEVPGLTIMTYDGSCRTAQYVVGDFDGEGSEDVVLKGTSPAGDAFLLILNGSSPRVVNVYGAGQFDSVGGVDAGYHSLSGCFDNPEDAELLLRHAGFAISHDDKFSTYHFFVNGVLREQGGSGC